MTPAGWHPDPTGRFELRYWDGATWTAHVSRGGQQAEDPLAPPPPPVVLDPGLIEHLAQRLVARTRHDHTFSDEYDEMSFSVDARRHALAAIPVQLEMARRQLHGAWAIVHDEPVVWLDQSLAWQRRGFKLSNPMDGGGWLTLLTPTRIVGVLADGYVALAGEGERVIDASGARLAQRVLPLEAMRLERRRASGAYARWSDEGFEVDASSPDYERFEALVRDRRPEPTGLLLELVLEPKSHPDAPRPDWYPDPTHPPAGRSKRWRWWDGQAWTDEVFDDEGYGQFLRVPVTQA